MQQFAAEAKKAGLTVNDAMRYCCGKSWAGFNANWYRGREDTGMKAAGTGAQRHGSGAHNLAGQNYSEAL
ncbi:MAG: hypothetical protein KIT63_13415 [Rhodoferax sp.]|nr:hypothetical protein [Rhodoferax sp.]